MTKYRIFKSEPEFNKHIDTLTDQYIKEGLLKESKEFRIVFDRFKGGVIRLNNHLTTLRSI